MDATTTPSPPPSCPPTTITTQVQVTQHWDSMAGEWDDLAWHYAPAVWNDWFAPQIRAYLLQQQQRGDNDDDDDDSLVILDFGCGTGMLIEQLLEHRDTLLEGVSSQHTKKLKILAVDASSAMLRGLNDKIRSCGWNDDTANTVEIIVHQWQLGSAATTQFLAQYAHTVHIVLASLVLSYIPPTDTPATLQAVGSLLVLLNGGGLLLQTDWPPPPPAAAAGARTPRSGHPMTVERAQELYSQGGLVVEQHPSTSITIRPLQIAPGNAPELLFGVATTTTTTTSNIPPANDE